MCKMFKQKNNCVRKLYQLSDLKLKTSLWYEYQSNKSNAMAASEDSKTRINLENFIY